jgi:hypothetical protein
MVAFKLLDKALTQLKTQREFGNFGGMAFSEHSLTSCCSNMQPQKSQSHSQSGVTVQTPRTSLKSKVTWAKSLELLGGKYEPWTVSQPAKPILKPQEYADQGYISQETHWSEQPEALTNPAPMITSIACKKSTCIKLLTNKKRSREVAFSD